MSKKHPLSQKQIALISFLSKILIKNSQRSCPYLVKKTSILSNLHIMTKKVNRMSFFGYFTKKICSNAHIFSKKNVHSLKKHCFHAHILSKKCPFFQKHCALMSIFSKFSSKTPCCHAHIWSKTSILSKLHYIMSQKSQYDALFFRFLTEKSSLSCPYFVKNDHSPKSTLLSSLDFVIKTAILSKTLCSYVIFSNFSWQTPCCQDLIW